ncbi:hypothetical protein M2H12_20740 [Vibrio vulnificus]|nr:hypothetical protein [Vibrio vulnificus]EJN6713653.1 hypothetical protein [Vibrio vulnificus]MCU8168120.1 hypothetical protein [Vibrio vulnificus]MCU8172706.1 hypothetical protein [Vibrio vulnificus]MCU8269322.1 hypothetical protein [Vibrio vulnificus]
MRVTIELPFPSFNSFNDALRVKSVLTQQLNETRGRIVDAVRVGDFSTSALLMKDYELLLLLLERVHRFLDLQKHC